MPPVRSASEAAGRSTSAPATSSSRLSAPAISRGRLVARLGTIEESGSRAGRTPAVLFSCAQHLLTRVRSALAWRAVLVLLPPSEGKTAPRRGAPVELAKLAYPELNERRADVLEALA